jgi:hypothetical protein
MTSGFAISNPPLAEMGVPFEHGRTGPCQRSQNICTPDLPWYFCSPTDHTTPALQFLSFDTNESGEDNHMCGKAKPPSSTFPGKASTSEWHR